MAGIGVRPTDDALPPGVTLLPAGATIVPPSNAITRYPSAADTAPPTDKRDALGYGMEVAKTNLFVGLPYALRKAFGDLPPEAQQKYLDQFQQSQIERQKLLPGGPRG